MGNTIEEIAKEHCSPDAQGCLIGLLVCRKGEFFQNFAVEFAQHISPEAIQIILEAAGLELKTSLKTFDDERK